jgi:hypothetical protein
VYLQGRFLDESLDALGVPDPALPPLIEEEEEGGGGGGEREGGKEEEEGGDDSGEEDEGVEGGELSGKQLLKMGAEMMGIDEALSGGGEEYAGRDCVPCCQCVANVLLMCC